MEPVSTASFVHHLLRGGGIAVVGRGQLPSEYSERETKAIFTSLLHGAVSLTAAADVGGASANSASSRGSSISTAASITAESPGSEPAPSRWVAVAATDVDNVDHISEGHFRAEPAKLDYAGGFRDSDRVPERAGEHVASCAEGGARGKAVSEADAGHRTSAGDGLSVEQQEFLARYSAAVGPERAHELSAFLPLCAEMFRETPHLAVGDHDAAPPLSSPSVVIDAAAIERGLREDPLAKSILAEIADESDNIVDTDSDDSSAAAASVVLGWALGLRHVHARGNGGLVVSGVKPCIKIALGDPLADIHSQMQELLRDATQPTDVVGWFVGTFGAGTMLPMFVRTGPWAAAATAGTPSHNSVTRAHGGRNGEKSLRATAHHTGSASARASSSARLPICIVMDVAKRAGPAAPVCCEAYDLAASQWAALPYELLAPDT